MNVTVNEVDQHKVTLRIEVPAKDASKQAAAACKNLASRVNIPGFRKGKAPRMVLESFLGKDAVKQEVFEAIANKAYSDALDQEGIVPVTEPELNVISDENGKDVVFEATVTKKPEVKLGEYKGITVAKDKAEVSDEDVAKELANLQKQHAKLVVAPEGTEIAKDDFAVIDFKGTVDGVAFEGGEGKSYPLQIGSGSFIPGFEDQLIGSKAGDEKDVKVTFPEDYFEKSLAGKEAVFAVKIDDLKADIRKRLESKASYQALEKFNAEVLQTVVNNAEVDIPQVMVDDKIDQMIEELSVKLETQRMNLDDYLKYMNQDMDKLKESYAEPAKENVKMDLVLEAISKAENIEVKDIDLQAEIITMSQNFGADPKEVYKIILKEHRVPMLVQSVGRKKAASFILSNAIDSNEDKKEEAKAEEPAKAED